MADRRWTLLGASLLLVSACSGGGEDAAPEPEGEEVACATAGATTLDQQCTVERTREDGVMTLIIHHPDGGFRRLTVPADGNALVAADGADVAQIAAQADGMLVTLGGDRYLLPAGVTSPDGP